VTVQSGGSGCVDVVVSAAAAACESDSDCELVRTGDVCDGQCSCGDTPVNAAAALAVNAATSSLTLEGCPCAFPGEPRCIAGACTLCSFGPDQPAGCNDSGTTTIGVDGGVTTGPDSGVTTVEAGETDSGVTTVDAGLLCVDIDAASYLVGCTQATDCTIITSGQVCSGDCGCGNAAISASSLSAYDQATSGIVFEACPCVDPGQVECISGACVLCTFGPNAPPGCASGG